jgi:hypothetical protein
MSWTVPKTWVSGNTLTAAELNTHVRDNFNAAIPVTSVITTTGTQTALAIPDGRGDLTIFANNASLLTLQGITAAQNGQTLNIISIGAGNVDIVNQSGSASAANRVVNQVTGTITLVAGVGRVVLVYDSTNSRWRVMQHEQGAWISPNFSASDFTGNGSMSWTLVSGDVTNYSYVLSGRVMTVSWYLVTTTVGGTPNSELQIQIPGGFSASNTALSIMNYNDNGGGNTVGNASVTAAGTVIRLAKLTGGNWSASTDNTSVQGQIIFEVS